MVLNVRDTMRFFYFQTQLILFLVLCDVKVLQCANKEELEMDLTDGRVVSSTVTRVRSQITLLDGPSASSGHERCNGQALVRLDFSGPYRKAKIELFYGGQPRQWTATIADSPKSYGFGSNHRYSSNCAEAQVFNNQLRIYSNMLPGHLRDSIDGYSLMEVNDDAVNRGANLTIELSDETVSWKIYFPPNTSEVPFRRGSIRNNPFLFTLSGQTPSYGPPQDSFVYAGFNRVPLGGFHNGSGLCRVRITFKRELEDSHCERNDCHKNAKCRPTKHSYKCVCKPGYQGNGKKCKELDICSAKNGGCQHRCHNEGGRFWCSCNEGYKLHPNMRDCIAKNEVGPISKRIRVRVTQGLSCKFKKIKDQFLERLRLKLMSQEVCNFPCTIYKPSLRCRAKKNEKLVFANFEIKLDPRDIYASKFCNATCTRCQMEERLEKFITVLRTMTDTERLNVSLSGQVITFKEKSLRVSRETDYCTEKPRRKVKRLAARCRPGQYFDIFLRKCANCSRGSYQPNKSETFCFRCPANKTTLMSGAQDISDCQETKCGGNLTSMSGVITSPNYPDPYPHGIECVWHIHCPKDRGLLMLIPKISIPLTMDCSDHLIMRENRSLHSRYTYYACESYENPVAFISRSKNLYIKFKSKSSNDIVEGFKIFFVTFEEKYRELVRSIVEDGALYANDSLRTILKDENLITQILDIMVHPQKFFQVERSAKNKIPEFYAFVESKVEERIGFPPYSRR